VDLIHANRHAALTVKRDSANITDSVTLPDEWTNSIDSALREALPEIHVKLLSSARKELKATDAEASLKGHDDDAWGRYRDAQLAVINSLQQAMETLVLKAAENNAELDRARAERFQQQETDLRAQLESERKQLQSEFDTKHTILEARDKALAEREAGFNTKEAGYVARKKMEDQIDQIKTWLDDWHLTKGTRSKRWPVAYGYVVGIAATAALTGYATYHNYDLLKTADDIAKLQWWQWLGIWAKTLFPLAAFTTFIIYFIRWSGAWARQHADEEFRNRTLLIDIGRSSWLLEVTRYRQNCSRSYRATCS
jgi:hypothetical protein